MMLARRISSASTRKTNCSIGRLDASRMQPTPNARRELFEAMKQVAETGGGPREQLPSMGYSIKWKH